MRTPRVLAAVVLAASLAGCFLPGGGSVFDPPIWDEAVHGGGAPDIANPVPFPSTIVGTHTTNDGSDYYQSTAPVGSQVRIRCTLTYGAGPAHVLVASGPDVTELECNGWPLTISPPDDGSFGLIPESPQNVAYRIVFREV
jgi:hypothetical protein